MKDVVSQLLESGKVEHAYIGVEMATITDELARTCVCRSTKASWSSACGRTARQPQAGLRGGTTQVVVDGESYLVGGDVITKADGQPIESA